MKEFINNRKIRIILVLLAFGLLCGCGNTKQQIASLQSQGTGIENTQSESIQTEDTQSDISNTENDGITAKEDEDNQNENYSDKSLANDNLETDSSDESLINDNLETDSSDELLTNDNLETEPSREVQDTNNDVEQIDEDGVYFTKDEVALYIHTYQKLPSNYITKKEAQNLGWEGGSVEKYAPGKAIGGDRFGNYEESLPKKKGRTYTECDIDTDGARSRGAKRIIFSNDGWIYYTEDHYESFTELYDGWE